MGKTRKEKKSTAVICYGLGLIVFCAIAGVIYYNESQTVTIETVTVEVDESYAGIYDVSAIDVINDEGNKVVGQRGQAYFNKEDMTADSLNAFYNDVVANSGYEYFTLINSDDTSKGIVFTCCGTPAYYGDINSNGAITNSSAQFEPSNYTADMLK